MTPKEVIRNTIDMAHEVLTVYLSDLDDSSLMIRPVPGANHIAWQLGHLIASEYEMLTTAGCKLPDLPEGFPDKYTKETAASDDPDSFHKKDEYLELMNTQREATLSMLAEIPDEDLDKATPEAMHEYAPTIASAFNIIGIHELMHAGQFVVLRRKLGKPVLI